MSLHLVFSPSGWQACAPRAGDQDVVVLIGDGVYLHQQLASALALEDDLRIRGLQVASATQAIDYAELVELCSTHKPVVSWHR